MGICLDLSRECAILMESFYSNLWDWQFMSDAMLKQLSGFQKYEMVRIRMQHIVKLCQFQYGQYGSNVPLLPPIWNSQYNKELLVDGVLGNRIPSDVAKEDDDEKEKGFTLDGMEWSEWTIRKRDVVHDFLEENYVRILWLLPIEHRK